MNNDHWTITPQSGSGGGTLQVTPKTTNTSEDKTATVTVKTNGGIIKTVNLFHNALELRSDKDSLFLIYANTITHVEHDWFDQEHVVNGVVKKVQIDPACNLYTTDDDGFGLTDVNGEKKLDWNSINISTAEAVATYGAETDCTLDITLDYSVINTLNKNGTNEDKNYLIMFLLISEVGDKFIYLKPASSTTSYFVAKLMDNNEVFAIYAVSKAFSPDHSADLYTGRFDFTVTVDGYTLYNIEIDISVE